METFRSTGKPHKIDRLSLQGHSSTHIKLSITQIDTQSARLFKGFYLLMDIIDGQIIYKHLFAIRSDEGLLRFFFAFCLMFIDNWISIFFASFKLISLMFGRTIAWDFRRRPLVLKSIRKLTRMWNGSFRSVVHDYLRFMALS